MCFGTFDIIHPGHIAFLEAAARCGRELIVVVSRDARRKSLTGSAPVHTQSERMLVLQALKSVKRTVAGHATDLLFHVKKIKPDVIVLGHDQTYGVDVLVAWAASQKKSPQIVRLKPVRRSRYSTSRIKKTLCL